MTQVTIRIHVADATAFNTPHSIEDSLRKGDVVLFQGADKCARLFHNCWKFIFSDKEKEISVHFKILDTAHEKIFHDKDLQKMQCACPLGKSIVRIDFSTSKK
jgi:hypothetical protein